MHIAQEHKIIGVIRRAVALTIIAGVLSAFATPLLSHAQNAPADGGDNIVLYVTPRHPGPNEEVVMRAENYVIDINRAEVSWYLNGVLQKQGIGENRFSFTTGAIGSTMVIRVVIRTMSGELFKMTHTINSGVIDLLWRADTYSPPFYKGKALATAQSEITVTAIPFLFNRQGGRIAPKQLIYTWRKDGIPMKDKSGMGKQSIAVEAARTYQNTVLTVNISSVDRQIVVENSVAIPIATPNVVFYEKHPLEGIRHEQALVGTFRLPRKELALRAEPYFFPLETIRRAEQANFEWELNGRLFTPRNIFEAIFRQREGVRGRSRINLTVQDPQNLQQATASLFIDFSTK